MLSDHPNCYSAVGRLRVENWWAVKIIYKHRRQQQQQQLACERHISGCRLPELRLRSHSRLHNTPWKTISFPHEKNKTGGGLSQILGFLCDVILQGSKRFRL